MQTEKSVIEPSVVDLSGAPHAFSGDRILEEVRAGVAEFLAREENLRLDALEVTAHHPRPFSTVRFLRARSDGQERRLVMKTIAHHPQNEAIRERANQAVVQHDILGLLYPRFQHIRNCAVPRPILVLPERETLVTEFIEGTVLADDLHAARYFASPVRFDQLRDAYLHCGRWLKHFQAFTGTRSAGLEALEETLRRTDYRLTLIENADDRRCPKDLPNQVRRLLLDQRAELAGQPVPVSGCHGDFGPWNVLRTPHGIAVLDFFGYQDSPIAEDLVGFLLAIEQERKCLTADARRLDLLRDAVLEGVGPLPRLPKPLLVICETLHRVRSLWSAISIRKEKLHHRWEQRRRTRLAVEWLTDERRRRLLWPAESQI
jgi:hypothetical protein